MDLAEIGVDALLRDGGLLEQVPVLKSIVSLGKAGVAARDWIFTRKIVAFLDPISDLDPERRAAMLVALSDPTSEEKAAERLLVVLDRLDAMTKASLLGRLFRVLVEDKIDRDEFWRMSFVIDRVPIEDLKAVAGWGSLKINRDVGHDRKHVYLGVGLVWFVNDMSSTGFQWEERLCTILADHLLAPTVP